MDHLFYLCLPAGRFWSMQFSAFQAFYRQVDPVIRAAISRSMFCNTWVAELRTYYADLSNGVGGFMAVVMAADSVGDPGNSLHWIGQGCFLFR